MGKHANGLSYYMPGQKKKHGMAKLTPEIIVAIKSSKESVRSLAKIHGVSASTIWAARSGHTYCGE